MRSSRGALAGARACASGAHTAHLLAAEQRGEAVLVRAKGNRAAGAAVLLHRAERLRQAVERSRRRSCAEAHSTQSAALSLEHFWQVPRTTALSPPQLTGPVK